ncbi:hypothetical protein H0H92_005476 [Tricholoma furcatifolium]|nr:hypothetical protein H0H92_005476 [Tricholoma furcatifolium]
MSAFARFLRPLPASRRSYSSYFSSKSGGGGRYFTSAKLPKVVVTGKGATPKAEPATEATADSAQASTAAESNGKPSNVVNAAEQPSSQSAPSSSASSTPGKSAPSESSQTTSPADILGSIFMHRTHHPVVTAKDFKLHQFFSLHRPLLLLSRPNSILESANASSFLPSEKVGSGDPFSTTPQWLLDDFPEATVDADAVAARQLSRALTMTHAGAAVQWEDTLRRLGLDVSKDADRVALQEKMDLELQGIMMDSTKRKRRKKMKKHKRLVPSE